MIITTPEFRVGDKVLVGPQSTVNGYVYDEFTGRVMRIISWSPYYMELGSVDTDDDKVLLRITHRRTIKT